jgi:hypothetical protein
MTMNKLVMKVIKLEGKKKSVDIAQIREIIAILSDIMYEEAEDFSEGTFDLLVTNGEKRAEKKVKKKK